MFDTLKAANRLRDAGFDEKQAQELVATFAEGVGENVATRGDVKDSEERLQAKIEAQGKEICGELRELDQRMTIKLGGMLIAASMGIWTYRHKASLCRYFYVAAK